MRQSNEKKSHDQTCKTNASIKKKKIITIYYTYGKLRQFLHTWLLSQNGYDW